MAQAPGPFSTRSLIQVVDTLLPTRTFLSENFATAGTRFTSGFVEVQTRRGQRLVAPYVNELLPGKIMERNGYQKETFEPAMVKPMRAITSVDLYQASFGENVYSEKTPQQRADELLAQDTVELMDYMERRKQVQIAELMFEGTLTQIGDGVKQVLEFPFENKEVLEAAEYWTADGVNPLAQLAARVQIVQRKSGRIVTKILMAPDAAAAFIGNSAIQELLDLRNYSVGTVQPREQLDGANFIGHFNYPGMSVDIWSFNDIYLEQYNPDGSEKANPEVKELVPSGMVALLPDGPLFRIHYGAITITNQETNGFTTYIRDIVPQSWITIEPAARFLQLLSKPLPVPIEIDAWYVMQVIAKTAVDQTIS